MNVTTTTRSAPTLEEIQERTSTTRLQPSIQPHDTSIAIETNENPIEIIEQESIFQETDNLVFGPHFVLNSTFDQVYEKIQDLLQFSGNPQPQLTNSWYEWIRNRFRSAYEDTNSLEVIKKALKNWEFGISKNPVIEEIWNLYRSNDNTIINENSLKNGYKERKLYKVRYQFFYY
jgi:hypothetical protein